MTMLATMPKVTAGTIDMADIDAELRPLDSDQLRGVFAACYGKAADALARMATCVKLWEERNEDVSHIPRLGLYRRIASGQVVPEAVWRFSESPARDAVTRLPVPDQRRLATDPMVPVVEGSTVRMVDLTQVPRNVLSVVVGPDGIRSPEEQLAYLGSRRVTTSIKAAARKDEPADRLTRSMTVRLTPAEFSAIVENAAAAAMSDRDYLRHTLRRAGAFKRPRA